jgi:hypothetical protein
MRRYLLWSALASLVCGGIASISVAWLLAYGTVVDSSPEWKADSSSQQVPVDLLEEWDRVRPDGFPPIVESVSIVQRSGVEAYSFFGSNWKFSQPESENFLWVNNQWRPIGWVPQPGDSDWEFYRVMHIRSGWPLPCLEGKLYWSRPVAVPQDRSKPIDWWAIDLTTYGASWPNMSDHRLLPCKPLLPGLAVNVLVLSLPAIAILCLTRFARWKYRTIRRQCPRCAYPIGEKTQCPECGLVGHRDASVLL